MAAYAQVDNLREEYGPYFCGPVASNDDIVEMSVSELTEALADALYVVGRRRIAAAQPAPLTIEAGKYYRTRDGRKVGPISKMDFGDGYPFEVEAGWWVSASGKAQQGSCGGDLIAEWVDEPKSTKEILDELEAWMAEQDASRDNDNSTTGFTVPLCAYELTDEGRQVAESYKQGYEDGYQRGRRENEDKPITVNVAVTLAETVDIPDHVAARVREALRTYYGKAA